MVACLLPELFRLQSAVPRFTDGGTLGCFARLEVLKDARQHVRIQVIEASHLKSSDSYDRPQAEIYWAALEEQKARSLPNDQEWS